MVMRSNLHLFKEGVFPSWEDPRNEKGGKWVMEQQRNDDEPIDQAWLNSILAMISETYEDSEDVNGCVISLRPKKNRISLWTGTASDRKLQERIGYRFRKVMELKNPPKVHFTSHEEARLKGYRCLPMYSI